MGASVSPAPESGLVAVSRQAPPRRYYRDAGGQLYYVDARGALHTVVRSQTVTETGGGLYYYEEDVPYVLDDRGVLTVRDPQGRVYILEESGPGQVIDPLPILRGTDTERRLIQGQRHVPCADRFKDCLSGCAGLSDERDRRDCYDNCERVRDRCERGY